MTYEATVELKFDSTYTPSNTSVFDSDDFIPEEHFVISAPAGDLTTKQYFKLFEKFMLCVGMEPKSIHKGAMSLVFNDYTNEEDQRKICEEYELTMNEDLHDKFKEWKKDETVKENHEVESSRYSRLAGLTDAQLDGLADYFENKVAPIWGQKS